MSNIFDIGWRSRQDPESAPATWLLQDGAPTLVEAAGIEALSDRGGNSCRHALLRCNVADGKRHGAGTIVPFEQGLPSGLEVFTYDEPFPEELPTYVLNATRLTSAANLKYDEDEKLVRSILLYQRELLTDQEQLALRALEAHEKAKHTDSEPMRRALIDRWGNRGLPGVDAALDQGYDAFSTAVVRRVLREARDHLVLNRCPRCDRIPRTPMAKQCCWCHHDWHAVVENER